MAKLLKSWIVIVHAFSQFCDLVYTLVINSNFVFRSIIVPMSAPVAVTVAILNALQIWNEFILVLVLASSEFTKSLPVGVFSFSSLTSTQLGWQLAALVIAVLPVTVVYFMYSRRIAERVVAGSIKG